MNVAPVPRLALVLVSLAASALCFIVLSAGEARACMCEVPSPEQQLREAGAIFVGEAVGVGEATSEAKSSNSGLPRGGPITFAVEESWKGDPEERVVVFGSGEGGSGCGVDVREGERYLVYARLGGESEDGALETSNCEGTKPLADAQEDLRVLGPPEATTPEGSLPESGGASPGGGEASVAAVLSVLGLAVAVALLGVRRRRRAA